jgi:RecG-like helicase
MSRVADYFKSLVENQVDIDSAKLRKQTELIGASAAAACVVGEMVKVQGTVRAIRHRPQDSFPVVEAELWDGSGYITLLWMGRPKIHGIAAGRSLVVQGRISRGPKQQPAIYNPKYELLPND